MSALLFTSSMHVEVDWRKISRRAVLFRNLAFLLLPLSIALNGQIVICDYVLIVRSVTDSAVWASWLTAVYEI